MNCEYENDFKRCLVRKTAQDIATLTYDEHPEILDRVATQINLVGLYGDKRMYERFTSEFAKYQLKHNEATLCRE
jgi:hypothetical protein